MKVFLFSAIALLSIVQSIPTQSLYGTTDYEASADTSSLHVSEKGLDCPDDQTFIFSYVSNVLVTGTSQQSCVNKLSDQRSERLMNFIGNCIHFGGNKFFEDVGPDSIALTEDGWECSNSVTYTCCNSPEPAAVQW